MEWYALKLRSRLWKRNVKTNMSVAATQPTAQFKKMSRSGV